MSSINLRGRSRLIAFALLAGVGVYLISPLSSLNREPFGEGLHLHASAGEDSAHALKHATLDNFAPSPYDVSGLPTGNALYRWWTGGSKSRLGHVSSTSLTDHSDRPIRVNLRDGGWVLQQQVGNMWDRSYTCQSGLRCVASASDDPEVWQQADILVTLDERPKWTRDPKLDRTRTKTAWLGLEPGTYDQVQIGDDFDFKGLVFQPATPNHMWYTYSETPAVQYFEPRAQLDWSRKSRDMAVVFISSNSCPPHRSQFVHDLIARGVDVWSLGTCASEHETTDRVAKLKAACGDVGFTDTVDWRANKQCLESHFKFIISVENTLVADYASEKFFDPFGTDIVPVYWGADNIELYLPGDNSILDVQEYFGDDGRPDMDAIADAINYYNDNNVEYEKFFQWKKTRTLKRSFADINYRGWPNMPCLLCEKRVEMDMDMETLEGQ